MGLGGGCACVLCAGKICWGEKNVEWVGERVQVKYDGGVRDLRL